jgi:hypothetical protein
MEWKKLKLTRWIAGEFKITEDDTLESEGRPFRLEAPDAFAEFFGTLKEAQANAALRNELAITKADNARLRSELAEERGAWPAHINFADALEAGMPPDDDGRGIPHLNGRDHP